VQAGLLALLIEPVGAAAAPEPHVSVLLAMGLALIAGLRRRRTARRALKF
jgi:MYXO-CTERM domain-containing protein